MSQQVDETGIPVKSTYPDSPPVPALYAGFTTVFGGIGFGIGYAVYKLGATAKYDAKIDTLAKQDLGWIYLGLVASKLTFVTINTNLGIRRKAAKVNVPDQHVYQVHTGSKPALGYVLMESQGVLGAFNRAQRALQNYLEALPNYLATFFAAGYVFPFPTFITSIIFGASRMAAAIGYTAEPNGRMAGNIFGTLLQDILQGFIILAGVKALQRN
eukprot:TRINITY_DN47148_c0_g1_i1.p1 TRINITY_DN47148_c0_g1~~TRINITY_DN47148_c0_g1_i1.p1  ORF type:complete len:232 (-),score=33.06 TRINITY_DN47148_c0_g1_i1:81-722(-)